MKDIVAIIPARSGSKGVEGKNVRLLGEHPLMAYSIVAALKSKAIERVIVSTDSESYAAIAKEYGAEVPFLRPADISGDKSTDTQFFQHVINWLREHEGYVPNFFAHLRPTTPLRNPEIIDEAIHSFIGSEYSALRSVHRMSESSYKSFEIEDGKLKRLCNGGFDIEVSNIPRQNFPDTFNANGYIDVVRSKMIDGLGLIHGDCVQAFETELTYEVDELTDFELLEYIMKKKSEVVDILFGS